MTTPLSAHHDAHHDPSSDRNSSQDYSSHNQDLHPQMIPKEKRTLASLFRDPLTLTLILTTTISLILSGVLAAELVGRHIGARRAAESTECVVHDSAHALFTTSPPFLWQYFTHNYPQITIHTSGNQVKEAKKMTAHITVSDVSLTKTSHARGMIGSLHVQLDWPAEGIEETIQSMIPLFGSAISDVHTNPTQGTVELNATLSRIIVKPTVIDHKISLKMMKLSGLGSVVIPKGLIQPALDQFAQDLIAHYPLGLQAQNLTVTETGITADFVAYNSPIPLENDPCFAHL